MKRIVIIGAGIFGVVTALKLIENFDVTLIETNHDIMLGASFINQARVHRGYHYPRSEETTKQCIKNYNRFEEYFSESIIRDFDHYYCIASNETKTSPLEYLSFLNKYDLNYKIVELDEDIIKRDKISLSVLVEEYAFDGKSIREVLKAKLNKSKINLKLNCKVIESTFNNGLFNISYHDSLNDIKNIDNFDYVVNSTYSNINGIIDIFGLERIKVNHHLTELVIVDAKEFRSTGITIMDGNYMSIMPFNFQGQSTISNVFLTPHEVTANSLPSFQCNNSDLVSCKPSSLAYCNNCVLKPKTKFKEMIDFASIYLGFADKIDYVDSIFTVKTIIKNINDERTSMIYVDKNNLFVTVLAGKVDTVFEIADEIFHHFTSLN
jgi:hypothetical protein